MESIVVLGADRVGKTTVTGNTFRLLQGYGLNPLLAHFGAVSHKAHSPTQQFTDFVRGVDTIGTDYLLFDRFVSDTLFYEPYRYQLPPIPVHCAREAESVLIEASDRVDVVVIRHPWDESMAQRHRQEISELWPGCSAYWLDAQLRKRKLEHEMYYEFTERYLRDDTLIPASHIHYVDGDLYDDDYDLSYIDSLELKA